MCVCVCVCVCVCGKGEYCVNVNFILKKMGEGRLQWICTSPGLILNGR